MNKQRTAKAKIITALILIAISLVGCGNDKAQEIERTAEMYSTLPIDQQQKIRKEWSE